MYNQDKRGDMGLSNISEDMPGSSPGILTASDNQKISFRHFKNGFTSVIIIAHGYYNSKQCAVLRQLAESLGKEHDILMFDFRGHGQSSGLFTWTSREGNDLKAILDFIAPLYQKRGLIAFSMGASISINVLADDKRVDSFISVSAPSDISKIDFRFWELDLKNDLGYVFLDPVGRLGKGARIGPFWLAKKKPIESIPGITIPVMFIHGRRDWVIRPWHSEALYQKTESTKKIFFINNGSHAEYLMRDHPGEFTLEVKRWFFDTL